MEKLKLKYWIGLGQGLLKSPYECDIEQPYTSHGVNYIAS